MAIKIVVGIKLSDGRPVYVKCDDSLLPVDLEKQQLFELDDEISAQKYLEYLKKSVGEENEIGREPRLDLPEGTDGDDKPIEREAQPKRPLN